MGNDNCCNGTLISSNKILTSVDCLRSIGSKACDENLIRGRNPKTGQIFTTNLIMVLTIGPVYHDSVVIVVMDREIQGYAIPDAELGNIPLKIKNFIASHTQHSFNFLMKNGETASVFGKRVSSPMTIINIKLLSG